VTLAVIVGVLLGGWTLIVEPILDHNARPPSWCRRASRCWRRSETDRPARRDHRRARHHDDANRQARERFLTSATPRSPLSELQKLVKDMAAEAKTSPERADPAAGRAGRDPRDPRRDRRVVRDPGSWWTCSAKLDSAPKLLPSRPEDPRRQHQPAEGSARHAHRLRVHLPTAQARPGLECPGGCSPSTCSSSRLARERGVHREQFVTSPPPSAPRSRRRPAPPLRPPASEEPRLPAQAYNVIATRNLFNPTRSESALTGAPGARPQRRQAEPARRRPARWAPIAYLEDPLTKRIAGYRIGDPIAAARYRRSPPTPS